MSIMTCCSLAQMVQIVKLCLNFDSQPFISEVDQLHLTLTVVIDHHYGKGVIWEQAPACMIAIQARTYQINHVKELSETQ